MKGGVGFVLCLILSLMSEVETFGFIREILFPRQPVVNRVRRFDDPRTFRDRYAVLDTVGLIEQHGYPAEEHHITTDDGYNIVIFRMPGSPASPIATGKPVVFMQHGVISSSDSWVLLGPKFDLAYLLADAGYDVWLANSRGNTYGRSHRNLSTWDEEFWDFSFHEMGTLDLSKMIDRALEHSGQKNLIYIGHSMGTTLSYVLLSEMPEYNEKMRLVVSLSPIGFWKARLNPFYRFIVKNTPAIKNFLDLAGIYDLVPQTKNNIKIVGILCSDNSATQPLCVSALSTLAGEDPRQLNASLLPYIAAYYPAGTSTKTFHHLQKNIVSGILEKFDHGATENIVRYGSRKAPNYNLKKISAPQALIYGKKDALASGPNAAELAKRLRNVVVFEAVSHDDFNHMDFLWAINAKDLLYDRIIEIISKYRN